MISIKPGQNACRIAGIQPEAVVAVVVATFVFLKHGLDLTWTAGTDSRHVPGSLHYVGLAVDIGMPPEGGTLRADIERELRAALGDDYDVVVEADHIHIEFQPKRGVNL